MKIEKQVSEEIEADYSSGVLTLSNGDRKVEKKLKHSLVDISLEKDRIVFSTQSSKRDVESIVKTYSSHLENMLEGLEEDHVYTMKGVYAHFPMDIKQKGNKVVIENFMGERSPREIDILEGVDVSVNGEDLEVRGPDKEKVSQTAANIEQACKKGDRDPRTFQDGIYIVKGDSE